MTFQRTIVGLLILTIAGLAASFYINWKMATQLRTIKAFVESYVFASLYPGNVRRGVKWRSGFFEQRSKAVRADNDLLEA